jgi:hypothetical protein
MASKSRNPAPLFDVYAAAEARKGPRARLALTPNGRARRLEWSSDEHGLAGPLLLCLPHILEPDERVEYVSLGAGNTGREFDLETNVRVAEFKFIRWRGGAESIRQNSIFKDYVLLAGHPTVKRKHLYLLGTEHALRFLRGGRALSSVLSRNDRLLKLFSERSGDRFRTVGDYFTVHGEAVQIEDVSRWLSELGEDVVSEPASDAVTD